ncbi:unnamed protein product [Lupinus luteus]|uniref:RNase H type-1 domain-containing protein n=1 Tax=Lupinus luteus TaxID=3873 RepID=A0AAV1W6M9_LUPLU
MTNEDTLPNVHWCCPEAERVKLDVDGSCRLQDHVIRGGDVLDNQDGIWLSGITGHFGSFSSIQVELLVVEHGLELTWNLGHRHATLENYYLESIHIITEKVQIHLDLIVDVLPNIYGLLRGNWDVRLQHIYKEGNMMVNFMSKVSMRYHEDLKI